MNSWLNFRWMVALCLSLSCFQAAAHFCDVPELTVGVGQTLSWRITADMTEEQTIYTPTLSGSNGVVQVFPSNQFASRHGDFVFTGLKPGTNSLAVRWVYVGNGNSSTCSVRIVVVQINPEVVYSSVPREGSLVGAEGLSIPADWLRSAIDRFIPPESQKLLVFSQCYAGNIAASPSFKDAPNTCILAATVQNQTGKYGGYHDDAARALKPEAGRTARTVHDAGVRGRQVAPPPPHNSTNRWLFKFENSEWPTTGGTLAPESFSLEPITPNSQVQSRHVVVFMGEPGFATNWIEMHGGVTVPSRFGAETLFYDNADRDAIVQNFSGQPNTTVSTAGGLPSQSDSAKGSGGWEMPGNSRALSRAIRAAGAAIRASENPAREQFILFVGDHGGTGFHAPAFRTNVSSREKIFLPEQLRIVGGEDALYRLLSRDPNSTPAVRVNVQPNPGGQFRASAVGFPLNALQLGGPYTLRLLDPQGGNETTLSAWTRLDFDWDEDGQITEASHEFVSLIFPVSESLLFGRFLGKELLVEFDNRSGEPLLLTGLALEYGNSPRTGHLIPPPRIASARRVSAAVELEVEALQFETYIVERSSDLRAWTPILTNQPTREVSTIRIPSTLNESSASYRLRWKGIE